MYCFCMFSQRAWLETGSDAVLFKDWNHVWCQRRLKCVQDVLLNTVNVCGTQCFSGDSKKCTEYEPLSTISLDRPGADLMIMTSKQVYGLSMFSVAGFLFVCFLS